MSQATEIADFQRSLPRVSSNTLSDRLKTLEENGVVTCRFYEDHPPRAEYLLTPKGDELRPILRALRIWGEKHATSPKDRCTRYLAESRDPR
jgi:DNA-binding HxlR family transcriptional regulator